MKIITADEKLKLIDNLEVLQKHDTHICGQILLLKDENYFIVIEQTDKKEYLFRSYADAAPAMEFITNRLELYERMWDGCGCKVNYYE